MLGLAVPQVEAWETVVCALSQDFDSDTLVPQVHSQQGLGEVELVCHGEKCLSYLVVMVLSCHVEMLLCALLHLH